MIFVFTALSLGWTPSSQLQIVMFLNLFVLIFLGNYSPFTTRLQNRQQLFNEVTTSFATIMMMCFTDVVPDESTKYKYGWVFIGIICANSGVNALGMLILFAKVQILVYRKINNRCKN